MISARNFEGKRKERVFEMNYVLKYTSPKDEFVGIDMASGGYPYPTGHLSSTRMFNDKEEAKSYLTCLKSQFPNDSFDDNVYEVVVRLA